MHIIWVIHPLFLTNAQTKKEMGPSTEARAA